MKAPSPPPQTPRREAARELQAAAWKALLDAIFPPQCAGCGTWSREVFCATCAAGLRAVSAPFCQICSDPFDRLAFSAPICARCRALPPHFEAARAAFHFEGPLREAVHRLKYRQKRALAPQLAPFLARAWREDGVLRAFDPHFLVPVPLHPARLRGRGFNQSLLLARELSALLGVPTRDALVRTRNTAPQVTLKGEARAKNVRGAFALRGKGNGDGKSNGKSDGAGVQGARVLLIDDVFTTGATLGQAAHTLRRAGAERVCALTLAR